MHGLWIAPGTDHELHMIGTVRMRALYIQPGVLDNAWLHCRLIKIQPLLRELIVAMLADAWKNEDALITPLLLKCLQKAPVTEGCKLPLPRDKRLLRICEFLLAHPHDTTSMDEWGERTGASVRTLSRRFREETALTFSQWRQQLRIAEAVCMLAEGRSLASIAHDLGYTSANAFGAMFKRILGEVPSRYLRTG